MHVCCTVQLRLTPTAPFDGSDRSAEVSLSISLFLLGRQVFRLSCCVFPEVHSSLMFAERGSPAGIPRREVVRLLQALAVIFYEGPPGLR